MKKTIEEAAEKYADNYFVSLFSHHDGLNQGFKAGAKHQSEQMYSEDDLYELLLDFIDFGHKQPHDMPRGIEIKNFINQLKKK